MTIQRLLPSVILTTLLGACDVGGGGDPDSDTPVAPPPLNQALGGAWVGTDNRGDQIIALSTDSGIFHWIGRLGLGELGFGTGSVDGTAVTLDYLLVDPLASKLPREPATCSATGTIQEHETLSIAAICTPSVGDTFSRSASLLYHPVFDRDSSLGSVAGNYEFISLGRPGSVMNISGDGVVFWQDPDSGCIINGQISVIDGRYNAYALSITFSSCFGKFVFIDNPNGLYGPGPEIGIDAPNGTSLTGLAILDNTSVPDGLDIALNGEVLSSGEIFAAFISFTRI